MYGAIGIADGALAGDAPLPPVEDRPPPSASLDELYRTERPGLLRYLARHTSIDTAHDVIQQVFVRLAARRPDTPDIIDAPRAYLRTAVTNAVRNGHRGARLDDPTRLIEPDELSGPDPVKCFEARDRLDRIEQAVRQLRPLTRQVFLARRIDGYSYAEIAKRTGLSERGVEKQMRIALHKLGRHLRRDE